MSTPTPPGSPLNAPARAAARPSPGGLTLPLLLVLGLLSAIAPLATDLYLPAFPRMSSELGASATEVQLTLTSFLVGLTVGQLVFGPLSDRLGRRRPLVVGTILFVLASVASVLAPTVGLLVAARLVQGLAGAAGMVIARAIVSDVARGADAARAHSLTMIVGGLAPVVGPVVGGLLAEPIGWRGLLAVILALSVLMLVSVLVVVRETLGPIRRARLHVERLRRTDARSPLSRMLASRTYVGFTLCFGFAFAVMMAYISASPFLFQDLMGFDALGYGLVFGANALAITVVSAVAARLVGRVPAVRLLQVGVSIVALSVAVALVLVLLATPVRWLMIPLFTGIGSMGLIFGTSTALALGAVPGIAGTAAAVLGALQFGLGALVSPLVGLGGGTSALPMVIVMAVCAALSACALGIGVRSQRGDAAA
jgi:DHA1 family bicyclomycin/chloramphenicol resistance-like MFS transporter